MKPGRRMVCRGLDPRTGRPIMVEARLDPAFQTLQGSRARSVNPGKIVASERKVGALTLSSKR